MSPRNKSYLLLIIATIIWGVAGPVIKYTENFLDPLVFLLYRLAISSLVGIVGLGLIRRHNWPKSIGQKLGLLVYCFLTTTVALGLLFTGYEKTSALTASILNALYPIMVAIAGVVFLRERITRRENVGMGIALMGTALVTIEPFLTGIQATTFSLEGNLLVIASLVVGVLVAVMIKLLLRHAVNPLSVTHLSFIVGFITLAPIVLLKFSFTEIAFQIMSAPWQAHLGVVYMALLSGTLAYYLWNVGQKTIEIGESSLFSYVYPLITLPLSIFWLKEPVTKLLVVGAVIITVGIVIAETKKHKASPRANRRSPG